MFLCRVLQVFASEYSITSVLAANCVLTPTRLLWILYFCDSMSLCQEHLMIAPVLAAKICTNSYKDSIDFRFLWLCVTMPRAPDDSTTVLAAKICTTSNEDSIDFRFLWLCVSMLSSFHYSNTVLEAKKCTTSNEDSIEFRSLW